MGKRLIIKGADFSANGIKGDIDVTPTSVAAPNKYWNFSMTLEYLEGFESYAIEVVVGKKYDIYTKTNVNVSVVGLDSLENLKTGRVADVNYGQGKTQSSIWQHRIVTATKPYLSFSSGKDTSDSISVIKINE